MRTWGQWSASVVGLGVVLTPLMGLAEASGGAEARRTLVMAQPLYGLGGEVGASVEHVVGAHVALAATVRGTVFLDDSESRGFSTQRWGVGVEPGVHFYLTGRAPEGFWVGPHLELSTLSHTTVNGITDPAAPEGISYVEAGWRTLYYGGSARMGYTAILAPGLTVQAGVGLVAVASRDTLFSAPAGERPTGENTQLTTHQGWSLSPRMSLGVGWSF